MSWKTGEISHNTEFPVIPQHITTCYNI